MCSKQNLKNIWFYCKFPYIKIYKDMLPAMSDTKDWHCAHCGTEIDFEVQTETQTFELALNIQNNCNIFILKELIWINYIKIS